jgi:transposase
MPRKKRKIDAALKARIALEALQAQSSIAKLALRYEVHANQIYAWRKLLETHAPLVFDRRARQGGLPEIEELHAKIGELTMERDRLAKRREKNLRQPKSTP